MKQRKLGEEKMKGQSNDAAMRFDFAKLRWDLFPDDALEKIAEVYTHGAIKYADENWRKGMNWKRMIASMKRHTKAITTGEDIDADSGCLHLAMIAWNAISLIWYQIEQIEGAEDNRVKTCKDESLMIKNKEDVQKQINKFWEICERLIKEREEQNKNESKE